MKRNIAILNGAGRWFGEGYIIKSNSLFRQLAGNLPGVLLWLAVLPLAALAQANYATPYAFITIAGKAGSSGSADGTNSAARFNGPCAPAVDGAGNLYVPEVSNDTIRTVKPVGTTWVVTTLAGKAGVAGSADGTNSTARFQSPNGVAVDTNGNVYVADSSNDTIRKMTPVGTNWVVTTLAGRAGVVGSTDGTNSDARFNAPVNVALDSAGNVYVTDGFNETIRKVTPDGTNWVVTTLAGKAGVVGTVDGTNSDARFYYSYGVAVDRIGNVYVSDQHSCTIRKVTPDGTNWVVTTLAGKAGVSGSADGTNSAARFGFNNTVGYGLGGLAVDGAGNIYVADLGNNAIRKVTPVGTNWVVTTLAGKAGVAGSADGTGSAALFDQPQGVAVDSAGNLYVTEYSNCTIRKGFPASSVPPPILQPPNLSAGQFGFGITGLPGLAVNIESSTNLSSWVVNGTYILNGGTNYYSVSPNPALGAQFYRAQVR